MKTMKNLNNFVFQNKRLQFIINEFIKKTVGYGKFDYETIHQTVSLLPTSLDSDSINWSFFQELFNSGSNQKMKQCICKLITELIKTDSYNGEQKAIVDTFKVVHSQPLYEALLTAFSQSLLPHNLIVYERNNRISCYVNDCSNVFVSNLLREFVIYNSSANGRNFYKYFEKSLCNADIKTITDFNAKTFKDQYYFYKKSKDSSVTVTLLKKFYIYLLNLPEGKDILRWEDGLDINMLQSISFNRNYENGYLPIPLNPFDDVPNFDKWLVMPNGEEKNSTKLNSFSYKPIDFSLCENNSFKEYVKHWFWHSHVSLASRIDQAKVIIKFLNFINNLRVKFSLPKMTKSIERQDLITIEEVFSYKQYAKANKPINYITNVKVFLEYLQENNLCSVDPSAFNYLTIGNQQQHTNSAQDIPDEDLIKLDAKLKEKANGHYINTLYYILFHLALATEFRISQIINLKVDCLIPGVKKEYYLKSKTKVSGGKKVDVPITPYTRRYIETAIRFTQEVRDTCNNPEIKEHIFIRQDSHIFYRVLVTRSFSDYLKRTCEELGINIYSAQNLRDTYMTKSVEYAMKNKLSDLELKSLTIHKKISTTTNNYVAEKIKDYLEATHMIVIGNPAIKGTIVPESNHTDKDLVNDECGYCPHDSCVKKDDNLDCLMCSGFIATIDRIPFFEQKIKQIDNEIKATQLIAEKERLMTIKGLYLAYLSKLLALQEATYE